MTQTTIQIGIYFINWNDTIALIIFSIELTDNCFSVGNQIYFLCLKVNLGIIKLYLNPFFYNFELNIFIAVNNLVGTLKNVSS